MEENVTIAGELLKSRSLDIGFSVGVYIASLRATHDVCFAKLIPAPIKLESGDNRQVVTTRVIF